MTQILARPTGTVGQPAELLKSAVAAPAGVSSDLQLAACMPVLVWEEMQPFLSCALSPLPGSGKP